VKTPTRQRVKFNPFSAWSHITLSRSTRQRGAMEIIPFQLMCTEMIADRSLEPWSTVPHRLEEELERDTQLSHNLKSAWPWTNDSCAAYLVTFDGFSMLYYSVNFFRISGGGPPFLARYIENIKSIFFPFRSNQQSHWYSINIIRIDNTKGGNIKRTEILKIYNYKFLFYINRGIADKYPRFSY
jgi:hypothetical protein